MGRLVLGDRRPALTVFIRFEGRECSQIIIKSSAHLCSPLGWNIGESGIFIVRT